MHRLNAHQRFGDFELERRLGMGGTAEVWLAYPLKPGAHYARVVLKVMHEHLAGDSHVVSLFAEEARLAQRLDHPNLVRIFESGQVDGSWYIAMEYVEGLDLRSAIEAHGGPLWPSMAAALLVDACRGLEYAHTLKNEHGRALNLVHRDISPDNLMVDRTGVVRLLDFGIARGDETETTTLTGQRKGKLRYMAPEYVLGHVATPASDVYSMGATLFELVTGERPFEAYVGTAALYGALSQAELPLASEIRPSLPEPLVQLIRDATRRDHTQRLSSARALESRLETFLQSWRPPSRDEMGAEVSLWRQRLPVSTAIRRSPGSFGQLETTEAVSLPALADSPLLEQTPRTSPEVAPPNLFLPPELEALAERSRSSRPRRRPVRRR